jgi:hypothetical protein
VSLGRRVYRVGHQLGLDFVDASFDVLAEHLRHRFNRISSFRVRNFRGGGGQKAGGAGCVAEVVKPSEVVLHGATLHPTPARAKLSSLRERGQWRAVAGIWRNPTPCQKAATDSRCECYITSILSSLRSVDEDVFTLLFLTKRDLVLRLRVEFIDSN